VADFDRERGTVTIVVQALGKTTREMRDHYSQGDDFDDFVGPLGLPQHIERVGHVVLVGGGLGVAPVFPAAARLQGGRQPHHLHRRLSQRRAAPSGPRSWAPGPTS
jgi:NAD(P)H-flavin reductase